jgi:thioredoxin reductase
LIFTDGSVLSCAAIFIRLTSTQRTPFAQDLGCTFTPQGLIQVDAFAQTTIPGLYAAGDAANGIRSVAIAVGHGATAAYNISRALINEDF